MESFDESVTVAVPVTRACEGWTGFKYFPDFMSVPEPSLPDVGLRSSLDEMWPAFDAGIGEEVPHRIAWLCLDGPSRIGVVVFSPLDAGNTRISVRFECKSKKHSAVISRSEVFMALSAFKDFMESKPVTP